MTVADKIMFEIYRETGPSDPFRVIYYTELDDENKDREIARAMAGEHVFDGFLADAAADEAKEAVRSVLVRLNDGERMDEAKVGESLRRFVVG